MKLTNHFKHRFREYGSSITNGLTIFCFVVPFIASLSGLWGWKVFGACNCAALIAGLIDYRADFFRILGRKFGTALPRDRALAIGLLSLGATSVAVNAGVLILYLVRTAITQAGY